MKKIFILIVFLIGIISANGQISITADSMVVCKSDVVQNNFFPISRQAESLSLEIDKDLMTMRVYGKGHEHAAIETAYILDLLEVNENEDKWMFQGVDKNCISYVITLDINVKRIDFVTYKNDSNGNKIMTMIYYTINDVNINKDAIARHLAEKNSNKY